MAKRKVKVPLTPPEEAALIAQKIINLRAKTKADLAEAAQLCEKLAEYCETYSIVNGAEIGGLKATVRTNPATIGGYGFKKGKRLESLLEMMAASFPNLTRTKIDANKVFITQSTDPNVLNWMQARGLACTQSQTWVFKAEKEESE